ncbi:MAG: homoserine dehydrogenase [Chloroflexi bacterium]|nr:homoserine dehydrogenase [Chloroflexota bacterium]
MKIALIGFGNVGRGFVDLLTTRREALAADDGFAPQVTAIITTRGAALDSEGVDLSRDIVFAPHPNPVDAAIAGADVIVELTPTEAQTGGAGLQHCRKALSAGKHVVTANKGPLVVAYRELAALAKANGAQFRFEGTVMGGTPAMVLGLETLAAAGVRSVRGIVNGTTNFILSQMEAGGSYADALATAQTMGYAEADPTGDVEGWDAAAKAVILANTMMGGDLRVNDVDREGITGITAEMIDEAKAEGQRWKLIAQVIRHGHGVAASVRPTRIPLTDPLALVGGGMNALTFTTEAIGEVTLMGAGAGGKATGFAILTDVLKIHRSLQTA